MGIEADFKNRLMKESTRFRRKKVDAMIQDTEELISYVSMSFGVDAKKKLRKRNVVAIRQSLILRLFHPVERGWSVLGRIFNMNHSTICYNYAKGLSMLETKDELFLDVYNRVNKAIKNYQSLKKQSNEN